MAEQDRQRVGTHEVWTEDPDVFCLRLVGDLSAPEAEQILDLSRLWMPSEQPHFWLVDVTELGRIGAAARVAAASAPPPRGFQGTVAFGVGFTQRLLATMMASASRLLQQRSIPITLFGVEPEARAHLRAMRRKQETTRRAPLLDAGA